MRAVHKKQFWEHNAVLITLNNQTFNEVIILDAWKNLGDFYWNYVSKDVRYKCSKNINKSKHFGNLEYIKTSTYENIA